MLSVEDHNDYELVDSPVDMTVRLIRGGVYLASVTYCEMAAVRVRGESNEVTFAKALARRRSRQLGIEHINAGG